MTIEDEDEPCFKYDVKYVVITGSEKKVDEEFIKSHRLDGLDGSDRRIALKGRCR